MRFCGHCVRWREHSACRTNPTSKSEHTEPHKDAPKMPPFSRVVKRLNSSKILASRMSPQMSNLMIDGSTEPQIFAENMNIFRNFLTIFGLSSRRSLTYSLTQTAFWQSRTGVGGLALGWSLTRGPHWKIITTVGGTYPRIAGKSRRKIKIKFVRVGFELHTWGLHEYNPILTQNRI